MNISIKKEGATFETPSFLSAFISVICGKQKLKVPADFAEICRFKYSIL